MFRVMNNSELQIADYVFVTSMAVELTVKIFAEGLIFTPNAMLKVYKNGYRIRGYCERFSHTLIKCFYQIAISKSRYPPPHVNF